MTRSTLPQRGDTEELGGRLRALRLKRGLGLAELGGVLGVSAPCISQWERALRRPRLQALRRLAQALDTSVDYLISGETREAPPPTGPEHLNVAAAAVLRRARSELAEALGVTASRVRIDFEVIAGE